jgi:cytochrome c-type biogenesis protein CcmH/NrfG
MSEATRQAALGALGSARAAVARLSPDRHPEDSAADLIEVWGSVETALRALLDGSSLSGQDLVREVRKREMITLSLAHSLLDFHALRERLNNTAYQPTASDLETARSAVTQLESSLSAPPPVELAGAYADGASAPAEPQPPPPPAADTPQPTRGRFARVPTWAWIVLAVVALGAAGAVTWLALGTRDELAGGRSALREGRREAARAEFERVARQNPQNADAHLFLARMAREERNFESARRHAEAAIRANPDNALAQREMGTVLYTTGNYQLAQRFLERAIRLDPTDRTAQGVMGCALAQQGNLDAATRFINRAGPGPWTQCIR